MGRRNSLLGFFVLVQVVLCPLALRADQISLNEALKAVRTKLDTKNPVSVSIQDETALLLAEYQRLDPLDRQEASLLASRVGESYAALYSSYKDKPMTDESKRAFEENARQKFRQVFAIALRLESKSERLESWFGRNPKTWHFLAEFIAIPGAVVAADYAVRGGQSTMLESVATTYGIGFLILAAIWGTPKLWALSNVNEKYLEIYESFLLAAHIPVSGGFKGSLKEMVKLGQSLGYPKAFPKCAMRIKSIAKN